MREIEGEEEEGEKDREREGILRRRDTSARASIAEYRVFRRRTYTVIRTYEDDKQTGGS